MTNCHLPTRTTAQRAALGLVLVAMVMAGQRLRGQQAPATTPRPVSWAQPLAVAGAPNLHKVAQNLYRSAQPTAEGFANLRVMGIKTIVCLRAGHSDKDLIGRTDLAYESIPMRAWWADDEDLVRFLKIVTDRSKGPVLVHCQHGADRTGMMCAAYRIVVEGWTKDEALREMRDGGFGYHEVWVNLPRHVQGLDVDKLREQAGLKQEQPRR